MKCLIFVILCSTIYCQNDTNDMDARKHYGLGYHGGCNEYVRVFKCLTTCKSLGYEVYRLDRKCKCTCLEMRTTNVLPYFKWRTTGSPKRVPTTRSARVYDVIGTLSPFPIFPPTTKPTPNSTCPSLPTDSNSTEVTAGGNTTTTKGSGGTGKANTDASGTGDGKTAKTPEAGGESSAGVTGDATGETTADGGSETTADAGSETGTDETSETTTDGGSNSTTK